MDYQKLEIDPEIKKVLEEPIPANIIHQREGGKKKDQNTGRWEKVMLDYISGATVIDYLNRSFDYMWEWRVDKYWIQPSIDKKSSGYDKDVNGDNIPKGQPVPQGPVAMVLGTLTVFTQSKDGVQKICKQGFGSKSIVGGQSEQESVFKAAATDALKKAASLLGIGASLYRDEEEQAYWDELNYVDPWTDEEMEKHKDDFEYLKKLKEAGYTDKELDDFAAYWDEKYQRVQDIPPEMFAQFIESVKASIEALQSQQDDSEENAAS